LSIVEEVIPGLDRTGPQQWIFLPSNEQLTLEDVIERFGYRFPIDPLIGKGSSKEPEWLRRVKEAIHITFIQTERLLSYSVTGRVRRGYEQGSRSIPAVIEYSRELAQSIQKKLAEYGSLSQSRDRTFPFRLLDNKAQPDLTIQELSSKLANLETKRGQLISTGLLTKEEQLNFASLQKIDGTNKNVLSVYINDVEEKLRVFDNLTDKIYLFLKLVNDKFLNKQMIINSNEGFAFLTSGGQPLSPAKLSSGEQHELVLLYELLFKVVPNSLILIDEPELSLHVVWQQRFLQDLDKITKLSQFDVLIATHSPQIIQNRWDLTVELKGPDDEEVPKS
jgi:predicted ATP-binding protein involved in virulence